MSIPSSENYITIVCRHTEVDIFTWITPHIEISDGTIESAHLHCDLDHPDSNRFFCKYCGFPFLNLVVAFHHGQLVHHNQVPCCFSKPTWLLHVQAFRLTPQRSFLRDITTRVSHPLTFFTHVLTFSSLLLHFYIDYLTFKILIFVSSLIT